MAEVLPETGVLAQPLTAEDTVLALENGRERWVTGSVLVLGDIEKVVVASMVTPNNLNVGRGFDDTAAAEWPVGTVVKLEANVVNDQAFLSENASITGPETGVAMIAGTAVRVQGPLPEDSPAVQTTLTPVATTPFFSAASKPFDPREALATADAKAASEQAVEPAAQPLKEAVTQAETIGPDAQQLPPQPLKTTAKRR